MSKVRLTRDLKIRLLKSMQEGVMETEAFPELQINAPKIYFLPSEALTDEQIERYLSNEPTTLDNNSNQI